MRAVLASIVCAAMLAVGGASATFAQPARVPLKTLQATGPKVPSAPAVLALVRSTMIAVDQGNKTGNYTVLRDLGAPAFRDANTAAKLALVFANLQGADLLPVLVVEPTYREAPRLTARRMLYVAGRFDIRPRAVSFELLYDVWQGEWRLYGVSIVPG